jgi:hypothetical protein
MKTITQRLFARDRLLVPVAVAAIAILAAGCSLINTPTPVLPTELPPPPVAVQTEVSETLTAVAPTAQGGGTPVPPPPTTAALATATVSAPTVVAPTEAPALPTPTPGGEVNPPTVQLLAPAQGLQLEANQGVNVVALVSDDAGIRMVEFYADNVLQATQTPNNPTTYQAVFPWSSAQVGQHTLFVVAYDIYNNASSPATVSLTVNADTSGPQVTILAPASPQNVGLGAQLQVQTAATDAAGVTQLQMLVDNAPYTQVSSQNPAGQNPFAATFIYAATAGGTHTILVRALDAAGNIGNSNALTVNVADNTPPSVTTSYSRYNVRENEQVTVYTNATDAAGIQRVELWADGGLYNVYNSPNPPAQTSLAVQQIWASNAPGNHTLFVRVFDVNNQSTTTPATTIFVRTPDQPTPTWTPFIPTRTPYPTRTPPPVVPPPNCQMEEPNTNFRVEEPNPIPVRWVCTAQGGLSVIQVYGQYSGTMATQISQEPGNGETEQGGAFDWTAPSPGVVDVFVVAIDRLGQRGESPHIPGVVEHRRPPTMAPPPTREPERPTLAGRWRGNVDDGFFVIELEPRIGCSETQCAYGGTFEDHRNNEIVRGQINGQFDGANLTLSVEGAEPGNVTWNFQGQVTAGGEEIAGQWSEARAGVPSLQRGTVSFRKE